MKLKCIYTSFKLCTKTKQKQNTLINCNCFWWSCASEIDLRTEHVLIAVENQSWFADSEMTVISQGTHRIDSHFHWFFLLFLIVWICAFVVENRPYTFILMDDDYCVLKYIEIVPLDNNAEQTEDSKPFQVKVCMVD